MNLQDGDSAVFAYALIGGPCGLEALPSGKKLNHPSLWSYSRGLAGGNLADFLLDASGHGFLGARAKVSTFTGPNPPKCIFGSARRFYLLQERYSGLTFRCSWLKVLTSQWLTVKA